MQYLVCSLPSISPEYLSMSIFFVEPLTCCSRDKKSPASVKFLTASFPVPIGITPIDTFSIYVGLTAANSVIIPASFGMHWAYLLKEISNLILDTKDVFNPQLEVDGILITKYDEDYSEMQEVEKQYFEIASKYDIDIFKTRIHNFLNLRQDFRQVFKYDYVNFCMELLEKHNWFTGEN